MKGLSDDLPAMQPVLLVGAGRSGTNLIAMALGESDELHNLYEQRYVWSKGTCIARTDLRSPESATREVREYIRNHFARQAGGRPVRLVDKTPSNALKLEFCLRVFPRAKIVNIVRNPLDNIASRLVELQQAGQDVQGGEGQRNSRSTVLMQRLRHARILYKRGNVPISQVPAAALDQLPGLIGLAVMGSATRYAERVPGLAEVAKAHGQIAALCHQWREVVASAVRVGRNLPTSQYLELRYEDVVKEPGGAGAELGRLLGLGQPAPVIEYLVAHAKGETIGNWRKRLLASQVEQITTYLACEMQYFGYEVPT